jgi:hypothetical protein
MHVSTQHSLRGGWLGLRDMLRQYSFQWKVAAAGSHRKTEFAQSSCGGTCSNQLVVGRFNQWLAIYTGASQIRYRADMNPSGTGIPDTAP